jgi:hypothetical protein
MQLCQQAQEAQVQVKELSVGTWEELSMCLGGTETGSLVRNFLSLCNKVKRENVKIMYVLYTHA